VTTDSTSQPIAFAPIGHVVRPEPPPEAEDAIGALRAQLVGLVLDPSVSDGLLGVEPGSDLVVLTHFHLGERRVLQVHPRGDLSRPLSGVFVTRSPHRPNPIGLVTVRVERIQGTTLWVRGMDAFDGTPILDIKSAAGGFDAPYREPSGALQ